MNAKINNTNRQATRAEKMFRLEYAVATRIQARPDRVWDLLTDARDYSRWNAAVDSVEGPIALGTKLKLRVPVSDRTFTPKVVAFESEKRMVWRDGAAPIFTGERTFTLTANQDGTTQFLMVEVFTGLMLPMIKGSLPDFRPSFDQFALDLKLEAETGGL